MQLTFTVARFALLACVVGLLVVACSPAKKQDATQVRGAGARFHAITARSNNFEATSIYKALNDARQPRLIRLAATRGLLACASSQV